MLVLLSLYNWYSLSITVKSTVEVSESRLQKNRERTVTVYWISGLTNRLTNITLSRERIFLIFLIFFFHLFTKKPKFLFFLSFRSIVNVLPVTIACLFCQWNKSCPLQLISSLLIYWPLNGVGSYTHSVIQYHCFLIFLTIIVDQYLFF